MGSGAALTLSTPLLVAIGRRACSRRIPTNANITPANYRQDPPGVLQKRAQPSGIWGLKERSETPRRRPKTPSKFRDKNPCAGWCTASPRDLQVWASNGLFFFSFYLFISLFSLPCQKTRFGRDTYRDGMYYTVRTPLPDSSHSNSSPSTLPQK